jgi:hypothetical protein
MLQIPEHIILANIATQDVKFAWDEWQIKSYYWNVPQVLFDRLNMLSDDANMALTLAISEWVAHRFSQLDQDPFVLQFVEAAWAGTVHPAYCIYTETLDDEWRGPVRGPLAVAITIINDGLFCRDYDPEVATRACWMHQLAKHVLPDITAFNLWFESSVVRLEHFYSRPVVSEKTSFFNLDLTSNQPVPRKLFELDIEYSPEHAFSLIDEFLKSLDVYTNPCLRPLEELINVPEFDLKPYTFAT